MEWIGTGFTLTIGGVRLRIRIALEDTPPAPAYHEKAYVAPREQRDYDGPVRRHYRVHPR